MSYKRADPNFKTICQAAHKRVVAVLRCLAVLAPGATPRALRPGRGSASPTRY
jgi:hypothetical protein